MVRRELPVVKREGPTSVGQCRLALALKEASRIIVSMPSGINVNECTEALLEAGRTAGFTVTLYGTVGGFALPALIRAAKEMPVRDAPDLYLSAGTHGDEPAGPLAMLELLQSNVLPPHLNYYICPLMNPVGLSRGSRENGEGIDLNRDYRDFRSDEARTHRDWISAHLRRLDLSIHLHEDWESSGFYLYELNFTGRLAPTKRIMSAVAELLPIEPDGRIDGRRARAGVIRPRRIPDIPEGLPEAIYLQESFGGINYTLETPSSLEMETRVAALKAAVLAAIPSAEERLVTPAQPQE